MTDRKMINYGHQFIDDDDINIVTDVLRHKSLSCGETIYRFENNLCEYTGFKYASAVSSGTAALHCALFAAGITYGDDVIVPSITFVATANAVRYCGGNPVFCDVNESLLINVHNIEKLITPATRAIISVDYGGQLCDYSTIRKICDKYNLIFISDSCHAFGAIKKDSKIVRPDMICYSFHPVKHITTGEGGAVLTNKIFYDLQIKCFRNHGRRYEFDNMQFELGYNYRMSDINAALGISQLKKLDKFIDYRKRLAENYSSAFQHNLSMLLKQTNENVWHLFVLKINNRDEFIKYMRENYINCVVHYPPVYDHPYYKKYHVNCPYTAAIKRNIVSIPIFYGLTEDEQLYIITKINNYLNKEDIFK